MGMEIVRKIFSFLFYIYIFLFVLKGIVIDNDIVYVYKVLRRYIF